VTAATAELRRTPSVVEVAEAMYQGGKGDHPALDKLPECLDELGAGTQRRYLLLARAAIECITGEAPAEPAAATVDRQLLDDLAHQLAFKLNHQHSFADDVREVLERYAAVAGEDLDDDVRKAMAI
jgi:hypothetical protein